MKKTLSIILSVLMIVSCIPLFASADETIVLTSDNVVEWPTADKEIYYGQKAKDEITLVGGVVTADGTESGPVIPGTWEFTDADDYLPAAGTRNANIRFVPSNSDLYSGFEIKNTTLVKYKVNKPLPVLVDENNPPVATEVEAGAKLSTSTLSGGQVKNPYYAEEPKALAGYWRWTTTTTVVNESGYYQARMVLANYEVLYMNVYVRIIGDDSEQEEDTNVYGSVTKWPDVDCSEWSYGLKVGELTLSGGEATVDGTFVIKTAATTLVLPNTQNTVSVEFVPADSTVVMTGNTSVKKHFTPTYIPKDFELTGPTKADTFEYGTALNNRTALGFFGIETNLPEGIRADMRLISAVDENGNEVDIKDRYLVPGTYTATATVYVPDVSVSGVGYITLYNPQNVEVTYIITKKTETSRFASASLSSFTDDFAEVYLQYIAKAGANGYCVVKAGDDILLDNITSEAAIVRIPAHKSGTYTLTFEYIPAEDDCIEFSSTVIEIGEVTFNIGTTPDDGGDDDTGDNGDDNVNTDCKCLCHSNNSILQIIWKLINFLCRLFGINQNCACGAAHYDAPIFG